MPKKSALRRKARKSPGRVTVEQDSIALELRRDIGKHDVLLGRGNGIANYQGNISFRNIVWGYRDAYERAHRDAKRCIAIRVMRAISALDPPGQFVERYETGKAKFVAVSEERALEKTCQALREKKIKPRTHH